MVTAYLYIQLFSDLQCIGPSFHGNPFLFHDVRVHSATRNKSNCKYASVDHPQYADTAHAGIFGTLAYATSGP
jgi:hypothetical protein